MFPEKSWTRFAKGGDRSCFDHFYLTNSCPMVIKELPENDVFCVIDITEKIVQDLDKYTS